MRKKRTPYEEAAGIYTKTIGATPTQKDIEHTWHAYATNWKQYDGYAEYLVYCVM